MQTFFYLKSNTIRNKQHCKTAKILTHRQVCVFSSLLQSCAVRPRACSCASMFLLDISNRQHSKPSVHTTASRPERAATFLTNTVISQIFTRSYKAKKIRHLFIWITKDFALLLIKPHIPKSIWIKVFDYQFPSNPRLRPSVASADIRWGCAAASGEEFHHTFSFLRRLQTIMN